MKRLNRKKFARVLAGVLSVLLLAGCGTTAVPEETINEEEIWGTAPEETKGIEVETEYFTFDYPLEWENKVEEVRTQEGRNTVITFRTKISDQDIVLFSIILGPDDADAYLLGFLEDGENTVNVYSAVNDMPAEDWSKEEYDEICSLQERVNEIIIQFHEDERFVPNR